MKIVSQNKKALFDYAFSDKYQAGLVLSGAEVKSAKSGQINLKGSYVKMIGREFWLIGAYIAPYKPARQENYDPERSRKILLTKKEITELDKKLSQKGFSLIPINVFLDRGLLKLTIGYGRAKKMHDKRESLKEKDIKRDVDKDMKSRKL